MKQPLCEKSPKTAVTPEVPAPSPSPAVTADTEGYGRTSSRESAAPRFECPISQAGYDIAAYYWPAHHDEPRWRQFMPDGEGEWEIIRKAVPKFEGHRQPRVPAWGYENEACPEVMEKKIASSAEFV